MSIDKCGCGCGKPLGNLGNWTMVPTHHGGIATRKDCVDRIKREEEQIIKEIREKEVEEYWKSKEKDKRNCRKCGAVHYNNATLCTSCCDDYFRHRNDG